MNPSERRALLATRPNPDGRHDYVVTLAGRFRAGDREAEIELRYVPDRAVLEAGAFAGYLDAVSRSAWESLEHAGVVLLDDINDELVARWIQVSLAAGAGHAIVLEERQPNWENNQILQRLRRI